MSQIKEAIELLECNDFNLRDINNEKLTLRTKLRLKLIQRDSEAALALLRTEELKCKTCGGSEKVNCDECGGSCDFKAVGGNYSTMCNKCDLRGKIPCPNCRAEEPEVGDFSKRFREFIKLSEEHLSKSKIGRLRTYGKEACDIIDHQTQTIKDQAAEIKKLKAERKKYRTALLNIVEGTITACTINSMKYVAKQALKGEQDAE